MPPQVNNNISSKVRTAANTLHLHGGVQPQAEQQQRRLGTTAPGGGGRSSSMNMFAIQNREEVSTRTTSARTTAAAATTTTSSTRIKRVIATNTSNINTTNNNNNVSSSSSKKRTTTIAVAPPSYKTPTYQGATSTISVSRNNTKHRGQPIVVRLADSRRGEAASRSGANIPNLDGNVTEEEEDEDEGGGGGGSDEDDPTKPSEEDAGLGEASTSGATASVAVAAAVAAAPLNCATSPPLAFPPMTPSTPPRPTTPKKPGMSHSIASLLGVDDDDREKEEEGSHSRGGNGPSSTVVNPRPASSPPPESASPQPVVLKSGKESVRTHLATPPPPAAIVSAVSDRPLALTKKGAEVEEKEDQKEQGEEEALDLSGGSDKLEREGDPPNDGSVALDLCTKRTQNESVTSEEAQTVVQNESSSIAGVSGSAAGEKDTQEQCKEGDVSEEDGEMKSGEQKVSGAASNASAAGFDCGSEKAEERLRGEAGREAASAEGDQSHIDVAKIEDEGETVEENRPKEDSNLGTNIACVENSIKDELVPKSSTKSEAEVESGNSGEHVPEASPTQISSPAEKPASRPSINLESEGESSEFLIEPRTATNPPGSPALGHEGQAPEKTVSEAKKESLAESSIENIVQAEQVSETTKPLPEPEISKAVDEPQPNEESDSEVTGTTKVQPDPKSFDKSGDEESDVKAEGEAELKVPRPTSFDSESLHNDGKMRMAASASATSLSVVPESPMSQPASLKLEASGDHSESTESKDIMELKHGGKISGSNAQRDSEPEVPRPDLCVSEKKDSDMQQVPLTSVSTSPVISKSASSHSESKPEVIGDQTESSVNKDFGQMKELKEDLQSDSKAETEPKTNSSESESLEHDGDKTMASLASSTAPSVIPKSTSNQPAEPKPEAVCDQPESTKRDNLDAATEEVKHNLKSAKCEEQEPGPPQKDLPEDLESAESNDFPASDIDTVAPSSSTLMKETSSSDNREELASPLHVSDLPNVRVETSQREDFASKAAETSDKPSEVTNKPSMDENITPGKREVSLGLDQSFSSDSPIPHDSKTPHDPQPSPTRTSQSREEEDVEKGVRSHESEIAGEAEVSEIPPRAPSKEEKTKSPDRDEVDMKIVKDEMTGDGAEDSSKRALLEQADEKQESANSNEAAEAENDPLATRVEIEKVSQEDTERSENAEEFSESAEKASPDSSMPLPKSSPSSEVSTNALAAKSVQDEGNANSTEATSPRKEELPKQTTNTVAQKQEKVLQKDEEGTPSDTSKAEPSPKPVVIKLGSNYLSKKVASDISPPSGLSISGQTVVIPIVKPSSPSPHSQPTTAAVAGEKASPMSPTVRLVNIGGQMRISKTLPTDEKEAKGSAPAPPPAPTASAKPAAAIPTAAPPTICDTPRSASPKKPSRASTISPSPRVSSDSESEDDDDDDDEGDDEEEEEDEDDEDDSLSTSSSVASKTAAPSTNSTQSGYSVRSGNEIMATPNRLSPSLMTANSSPMHKTSKRQFACNVCGKECRNESDLSLHKKRHKVDQPFVCQFCDREYVDKSRWVQRPKDMHKTFEGVTPPWFISSSP